MPDARTRRPPLAGPRRSPRLARAPPVSASSATSTPRVTAAAAARASERRDAGREIPPPAGPRGPRVPRRSTRLARSPPASAPSSATSSSCRRRRGAAHSLSDPDATGPERPPPALTSDNRRRPLLLGFVSSDGFHPAEAPHPSAAVSRAVAAATPTFDYLPPTTWLDRWELCDVRDGRVLFKRDHWDHLVCDPLSRRYRRLPLLTDDLLATVGIHKILNSGACFIRSGGTEEGASFSVMCWIESRFSLLGVFVFNSGSGRWSVGTCNSKDNLGLDEYLLLFKSQCQCVYNCVYWKLYEMNTVLKLDLNSMRFCTIDLPPGHSEREIIFGESEESRVAMFSMTCRGRSVYYYTLLQNGSGRSHEWHLKGAIPLPAPSECFVGVPAQGYIFIQCISDEEDRRNSACFSLQIEPFKIERVCWPNLPRSGVNAYFGFPPSMSPRRI